MRSPLRIAALAVVGLLLAPAVAEAHKMEVEARTDGVTVRVVAGYEGDEPTEGATVTLTDAAGAVVAEGTTDAKGLCVLPRPKAGTYQLAVDDGAGHRAELALPVPESEAEVTARTERRNRWLMAAVGLAAIAGGTAVARLLRRKPGPAVTSSRR
ncbi:MAG TPA: SpaA isopeptide-forming pilin-related protein [Fimbriiglobus sp.]|nr:SpaA isopeptide-forming pilin-related protein [Fimbriiglobus sp.]